MKKWLRDAFETSVWQRAVRIAAVVGSILLLINHGDAILQGDFSRERVLRMILTMVVPYIVSTISSVRAIRECEEKEKKAAEAPETETVMRFA